MYADKKTNLEELGDDGGWFFGFTSSSGQQQQFFFASFSFSESSEA
jgi:hypothetical protein